MEELVRLDALTKIYDGRRVIDTLSRSFARGESVAFIGHNGCGKSTLLKLLAGLIRPSAGKVVWNSALRFSYVPEKFPGADIGMKDYLKGIADMERVDFSLAQSLIRDFYLEEMIHTRLCDLSKGSLQKVAVVQALLAPCDVLFLDEPLSGQDADSQECFIRKMNELRKQGCTLFMSCHEKQLTEALSDRVYTLSGGKLDA